MFAMSSSEIWNALVGISRKNKCLIATVIRSYIDEQRSNYGTTHSLISFKFRVEISTTATSLDKLVFPWSDLPTIQQIRKDFTTYVIYHHSVTESIRINYPTFYQYLPDGTLFEPTVPK